MSEWHAMVEKDNVRYEHIHQVFNSLHEATAWATQAADYLGGRPATFKAEICPVCRERRVSAMRAQNL
jgi:hypothetical protein